MISIHAPREGSDFLTPTVTQQPRDFYPRSPRGERREGCIQHISSFFISIHAPREGSDYSTWRLEAL